MVDIAIALIVVLAANVVFMCAIAFMLFVDIPEMINTAVSETRRNVYQACRGKEVPK